MHQQKLLSRILWLALAGVALRALVPVGYMPAPLADGLPFVLCPGSAPYLTLPGSGGHHGGDAGHVPAHDDAAAAAPAWESCPFGVFFGQVAPASEYAALTPAPSESPTFAEPDAIVRPALTRSWRARAPPA